MKKLNAILTLLALTAGVLAVSLKNKAEIKTEAVWGNETVRIYLDTTVTVNGLGWWDTNETYINFGDGNDVWVHEKMERVSGENRLFYYDIGGTHWNSVTSSNKGKIEFYAHSWDNQQNIVHDTDMYYLKQNELNLFKLNSANGGSKQTYELKNREVEEVIFDILDLGCDSTKAEVEAVVVKYNALRAHGKQNLNTWLVGEEGDQVTWYERLVYLANHTKANLPNSVSDFSYKNDISNNGSVAIIGSLGLVTIAGYYFLSRKKKVV